MVFEDTEDEHNSIYPEEKLENDKEDELVNNLNEFHKLFKTSTV